MIEPDLFIGSIFTDLVDTFFNSQFCVRGLEDEDEDELNWLCVSDDPGVWRDPLSGSSGGKDG